MRVTLKQLWESGGSLQRFGQLRFKGKAVAWKASRIHKAAMKEIEKLTKAFQEIQEARNDLRQLFGIEVERRDEAGNAFKVFHVPRSQPDYKEWRAKEKELDDEWEQSLDKSVEIWGDPFGIDELPVEFWGQSEERDGEGKVTKPTIPAMMSNEDIGALSIWLIGGEELAKAHSAAGD